MFDRNRAIGLYLENRKRSATLFSIPSDDDYLSRPISLRNPIAFYEGHLPVFAVNTLWKRALGRESIDPAFEALFARGIDPDAEPTDVIQSWPSRSEIRTYADQTDARLLDALATASLSIPEHLYLHDGAAVWTIIEHELMHQETLLYMFHRLAVEQKSPKASLPPRPSPDKADASRVTVEAGVATLGADRSQFGWDNEFDENSVYVDEFEVDRFPVTNERFREFVESGGYETRELWSKEGWASRQRRDITHPIFWEERDGSWYWRSMFELVPLPGSWPVYVSLDEARAFAAWSGSRIMSEPEYHRAAFGGPGNIERPFPWGEAAPDAEVHGNFGFRRWDPEPVDACPDGASAWGVRDLIGNGWEWTSSRFAPFPGFKPMPNYPEYSVDFFDDQHYVLKGASPVTHPQLIRRSFRNWFRHDYPYMYAKFRCVR